MEMKLSFLMASVMMIVVWELQWQPLSVAAATNYTWVGSKYQIECTMCSSCDNPCDTPSPPPPPPPPTTTTTTTICPPPPSPPHSSNTYYYSPPPPSPPSGYSYYPYTPPKGVVGGGYFPPPYKAYPSGPAPPPPNPIVPYFPFYFNSPPPPSHCAQFKASLSHLITPTLFLFLLPIWWMKNKTKKMKIRLSESQIYNLSGKKILESLKCRSV